MKKKLLVIRHIFIMMLVTIVVFCAYLLWHLFFDPELTISSYSLASDVKNAMRIVQLSDLHNAEFGDENADLIKAVAEQNPDIIVMTGDMVNADDPDTSVIVNLVASLVEIAPVYYGYGNHEPSWDTAWQESTGETIADIVTAAGATVLEEQYIDIEVNENPISIAGYSGYYRNPVMKTSDKNEWAAEKEFYDSFESSANYKILLDHVPTVWLDWNEINHESVKDTGEYDSYGYSLEGFDVDLVFSGHYHGGQWILPFIGGAYSPYSGFNPPYYKGIFTGTQATCVLSAGLGNEYSNIPRINNPPEIVVVDVLPEK